MKKVLLLTLLVALSFGACSQKEEEKPLEKTTQQIVDSAKVVEMQKEEAVVRQLHETPFLNFVKDIKIVGKIAIILFCENYGEYQTIHPDDPLTAEQYQEFWDDHDRVRVAFSTIPFKLFNDKISLNIIDMSLNHQNRKYYMNVERKAFFEIFDIPFEGIPLEEYMIVHRDKVDRLFDEKVKVTE